MSNTADSTPKDTRDIETKLRQDLGLLDWQIRDLMPIIFADRETHYNGAYQQGRIDEARTCEKAKRHDFKAQATALLKKLPQPLDDRDKNLEVPTAFKNGHNHALTRVRTIINEELEKLK